MFFSWYRIVNSIVMILRHFISTSLYYIMQRNDIFTQQTKIPFYLSTKIRENKKITRRYNKHMHTCRCHVCQFCSKASATKHETLSLAQRCQYYHLLSSIFINISRVSNRYEIIKGFNLFIYQ